MAEVELNTFLREFSQEIEEGNAAIFAGAGLSMPAGFVDWRTLLRTIAADIGLDIDKEANLVAVAQYYCNERNRAAISRLLLEEFTRDADVTESHRILARLPIATYWTTNYDRLIEEALEEAGRRPDVKSNIRQLSLTLPRRDCVVYKMHGDISNPTDVVLIKDDYERYYRTGEGFITALTGDLVSKTFLFLGFSFSDPNIDYILSRIRGGYDDSFRSHYCVMKRVGEGDFPEKDTFLYRKRQQELFVRDLLRFNIQTVLVEAYSDIPDVLARLERIYRSKSIFLSGAAHEWGTWSAERARALIGGLSRALIKEGYRIVSGFGLGVGSSVISGALEEIYSKKRARLEDQLILRPFPQERVGGLTWTDLLTRYRNDLTDYAGTAVFMFGNKLEEGAVVPSGGVVQEFEIARTKGLALIPIGATGYVARQLWERVLADVGGFYPKSTDQFRAWLTALGDEGAEPAALIDTAVAMIKAYSKT